MRTPRPYADLSRSRCRSRLSSTTSNSMTVLGRPNASETAWRTLGEESPSYLSFLTAQQPTSGPQHRLQKLPEDQPASRDCPWAARPQAAVASAAGAFALATSTRAANAAGSVTARSARILRSTSTPAALRPEMKRL